MTGRHACEASRRGVFKQSTARPCRAAEQWVSGLGEVKEIDGGEKADVKQKNYSGTRAVQCGALYVDG